MQTPPHFDLDLTVRSHGWYDLAPWSYEPATRVLARPFLAEGVPVHVTVAPAPGGLAVRVAAPGRTPSSALRVAKEQMARCLALDEDLGGFYALLEELEGEPGLPRLAWAVRRGAGRLLRSPTVWEDVVKTLCTTNCSWGLTRAMVQNLVARLGEAAPLGTRCFPAPEALAAKPERFFRDAVRAGYRAPFLRDIARAVASGELDVESWRSSPLDTDALGAAIRELPGFGPYATEHLLKLLGRYDHLALDSWSRKKLAQLRGKRRPPKDAAIRRWYAPYGRFAGLAMWLEATADWHPGEAAAPTWP